MNRNRIGRRIAGLVGAAALATALTALTITPANAIIASCAEGYTVQDGDTGRSVAEKHKISMQDLYRWNFAEGDAPGSMDHLVPGETLCVKVDSKL